MASVEHPEDTSNWISKLFVSWLTPLVKLSTTRTLIESDIWNCPKYHNVSYNSKKIWVCWNEEKAQAAMSNRSPSLSTAIFKAFRYQIFLSAFFQLLFLCGQVGIPFIVKNLVQYINESESDLTTGIFLAVQFGLISLVSSLSLAAALFLTRKIGMAVRSGIMMCVYRYE